MTLLKRADLHVHSNRSDGSDPPSRVVERAAEAGLAAIALTDHDTTGGLEEAGEAGRRFGVEVVNGIEISAEHEGREVHLLGFFFRPADPALAGKLAEMEAERARRIEAMVMRLNALGFAVTMESVRSFAGGRSLGRPHIADALVKGNLLPSYEIAWRDYLRPDGRAYVDRARLRLPEALDLIHGSGGVSSIAHPTLNLGGDALEAVAASGVSGFETTHPKVDLAQSAALRDLCRRHRLIETGGSDCHGSRRGEPTLGHYSVPYATVEALRTLSAARGC